MLDKILCVDDDPITLMLCRKVVERVGFAKEIITAKHGLEAIEYFDNLFEESKVNDSIVYPKLVLLDLNMPVLDGWEFLEQLLLLPDFHSLKCKVIMLSSSIDIADIQKSVSYSLITNFISKPLTHDKLRAIHVEENFKPYKTGTSG